MGQIANLLLALNSVKHAIRDAIIDCGGRLFAWSPMDDYPGEIRRISNISWESFQTDRHRVVFIDWDGSVLKDVMVMHGDSVTAPEIPSKWAAGLTFDSWTHPDTDMASVKYDMCIGAMYKFKTTTVKQVILALDKKAPVINLQVATGKSVTVIWGDGSTNTYTSGGVISHTYTDNAKEHVIIVSSSDASSYATAEGASGSMNYYRYCVFTGTQWRRGMSSAYDYIRGFGYPVGLSTPPSLSDPSTTPGRYAEIRGFVVARRSTNGTTTTPSIPICGPFFLAVYRDEAVILKHPYSSAYNTVIPIMDKNFSFVTGGGATTGIMIERFCGNGLPSGIGCGPVIGCSHDNISEGNLPRLAALNGTLEGITTASLTFYLGTPGLERLLGTLPARETTKTITIKSVGSIPDSGSANPLLPAALITELTQKGYTITYSNAV